MVVEFNHEAVVQNSPEILSGDLLGLTETTVTKFLRKEGIDCPSNARTFLQVHTYFAYMRGQEPGAILEDLNRFKDVIEEEKLLAKDDLSPSVGTEVEVPVEQFPITHNFSPKSPLTPQYDHIANDLRQFGMITVQEGARDPRTEFNFPATNSIQLQLLLIQEFVDMGFISINYEDLYKRAKNGRLYLMLANMHANFGIPLNAFTPAFYNTDPARKNLPEDKEKTALAKEYIKAMIMLFACGYTDAERINDAGFEDPWLFNNTEDTFSIKEKDLLLPTPKKIARLELRALNVTDANEMKQLFQDAHGLVQRLCVDSEENCVFMREFIQAVDRLVRTYELRIDYLCDYTSRETVKTTKKIASVLRTQRQIFSSPRRRENFISQARALASEYAHRAA